MKGGGHCRLPDLVWRPKVARLLPDADTSLAAEGRQNVRSGGRALPSAEVGQRCLTCLLAPAGSMVGLEHSGNATTADPRASSSDCETVPEEEWIARIER